MCVCVCTYSCNLPMWPWATYHKPTGRELDTLAPDVQWNLIDFREVILGRLFTFADLFTLYRFVRVNKDDVTTNTKN